jgi:hypothetical protein
MFTTAGVTFAARSAKLSGGRGAAGALARLARARLPTWFVSFLVVHGLGWPPEAAVRRNLRLSALPHAGGEIEFS